MNPVPEYKVKPDLAGRSGTPVVRDRPAEGTDQSEPDCRRVRGRYAASHTARSATGSSISWDASVKQVPGPGHMRLACCLA